MPDNVSFFHSARMKVLKTGFHLLYNQMAFTYDLVANVVSLGEWWEWQRAALPYLPEPGAGWLLELAHGTGRLQIDLHNGGWQSIGYDLSANMGRITRSRLIRKGIPARLVRGMGQALPFPDAHFSGVVCTFPTPFILETPTLNEIHRILQPGKRLVFVPSGVLTRGGAAKTAMEAAFKATGQRGGWHVDLRTHFAEHGFQLESHLVELKRSIAQVIVAEKQPHPIPSPHAERGSKIV